MVNLKKFSNGPQKKECHENLKLRGSSSAFPAISLGFTILGEIFAYVTIFNPAIEVER